MAAWKALLAHWKQLIDDLEDQEDYAILQEWLEERVTGQAEMMSLEAFFMKYGRSNN